MKLVLNVDSLRAAPTGIGNYTKHLIDGLQAHPLIESIQGFAESGIEPLCGKRKGVAMGGRWPKLRRAMRTLPGAYQLREILRQRIISRHLAALKNHLYHESNYVLVPFDGPTVLTVHDLSHIYFPGFHPRQRVRHLERNVLPSVERATEVVVDSETVRKEVIEVLGVGPEKTTAIPLGVGQEFHPRSGNEVAKALGKHQLAYDGYVLAVGTLEPRKNLIRLMNAYARLPNDVRRRHLLVIAGSAGWRSKEINTTLNRLRQNGEVRYVGYLPTDELPMLYAGARAFAFPSFYEGFGLPILEAMASGVPVLTSDRSSMPEVAGGAALLVDPEDVESMTDALERLLIDEQWREQARIAGLEHAKQFTWQRCVEKTVEVYKKAMKQHGLEAQP